MKVGKYQIGRFHAIIRKEYADGSVDYWQGYKTLLNVGNCETRDARSQT